MTIALYLVFFAPRLRQEAFTVPHSMQQGGSVAHLLDLVKGFHASINPTISPCNLECIKSCDAHLIC